VADGKIHTLTRPYDKQICVLEIRSTRMSGKLNAAAVANATYFSVSVC
jgi:hypothetical protein